MLAALPDPEVWATLLPARGDREVARAALAPPEEVVGGCTSGMCWRKGRHAGARACPFAPLVPVSRGPGALPCGVGQRVRWSVDGVSAKGRNPRVARDHVLGGPAELLGANDAKTTVEQAVANEAVLLVLGVGLDGTGLQVEVEDYALPA